MSIKDFTKKLLVLFILLGLYSRYGPQIPFSVVTQEKGEPLVVAETGKVVAVPDTAKIILSIQETGSTLETTQETASRKSKTLIDVLKKEGVNEKDIKTTSYNISPQYDFRSETRRITGYRVNITYEDKVKEIDSVNEVVVTATGAGANSVGGISFEVGEEAKDKFLEEARKEAVEKATKKAKSLAGAAGIKLGRILNISESSSGDLPRPVALRELTALDAENVVPELPVGETEISVSVSISWEIR